MYAKIAYGFWKKSVCVKSQKQRIHPKTLLLWQKVCVKRNQHQFTIVLSNWILRGHHWDEFYIKTLAWCHAMFNRFRNWRQLTIQCVFASLSGPAIDLQKMPILAKKNHLFRWRSFWIWRACKEAKLSHLGHRKPTCIHWKAEASKTCHCLVGILVQGFNWTIFLRK